MVETYAEEAWRVGRSWKSRAREYSRARGLSTSDNVCKGRMLFNPNKIGQQGEVAVCHSTFVKRRGGHGCGQPERERDRQTQSAPDLGQVKGRHCGLREGVERRWGMEGREGSSPRVREDTKMPVTPGGPAEATEARPGRRVAG